MEQSDGRVSMAARRYRTAAGEGGHTVLHVQREAEYITVQSGGVRFFVDGVAYDLGTGDSLIIDPYLPFRAEPNPETGADYLSLSLDPTALFDRDMAAGLAEGRLATTPLWRRAGGGGVLIAGCLRAAYFSCEGGKPGWSFAALGQLSMMYAHLLSVGAIKARAKRSKRSEFVCRAMAYVDAHYAEPITSTDAAADYGIDKSDFCRRFRAAFGTTFSLYLSAYRIEQAKKLLAETDTPVASIVGAVGFADFSYFSKTFREGSGLTPTAYRAAARRL